MDISRLAFFLPMPAALFLVIRLFDLTSTIQIGCAVSGLIGGTEEEEKLHSW